MYFIKLIRHFIMNVCFYLDSKYGLKKYDKQKKEQTKFVF